MAAQGWSEWLSGLLSGLWPRLPPQPGSHEARLEEMRVSALLHKELRKPAGQGDAELVHKLSVERYTLGLANAQVGTAAAAAGLRRGCSDRHPCAQGSLVSSDVVYQSVPATCPLRMQASRRKYKYAALGWDRTTRTCCGGAQWATQRIAASYHALEDFYEQVAQQVGIGSTGAVLRLLRLRDLLPLSRLNHCLAAQSAATPALPCPVLPAFAQMAEDLAATEARRPPVIAAQPTLRLELPETLQQAPPRLDMCSECAKFVQQVGRGRGRGWWAQAEHATWLTWHARACTQRFGPAEAAYLLPAEWGGSSTSGGCTCTACTTGSSSV